MGFLKSLRVKDRTSRHTARKVTPDRSPSMPNLANSSQNSQRATPRPFIKQSVKVPAMRDDQQHHPLPIQTYSLNCINLTNELPVNHKAIVETAFEIQRVSACWSSTDITHRKLILPTCVTDFETARE